MEGGRLSLSQGGGVGRTGGYSEPKDYGILHLDLYCSKCTRLKAGFGLQRVKADQKTTPAVSGWKEVPSVSRVSGRE
jgi:hypothetical protein